MKNNRSWILDWAEQGQVPRENLRRALELGGVIPDAAGWRLFLDRLLLGAGTVFSAAGVIFFLAYNWQDLGRYAKFGLVEACIVATLILVWRLGLERASGKAALLGASLLVGALFALIGQTYQTGADTFELFASWAAAILLWVLLGRFAALWLVWMVIVNLAIVLYHETFRGVFGAIFGPERMLWMLMLFNTAALALWEGLAARGIAWLRERWAARMLIAASAACGTALAIMAIVESRHVGAWGVLAWIGWMAGAYAVYRRRIVDLFALACGLLSLVLVVATFLGNHLLHRDSAGAFLFIGLVVIGLSASGGWWLKEIAREERA